MVDSFLPSHVPYLGVFFQVQPELQPNLLRKWVQDRIASDRDERPSYNNQTTCIFYSVYVHQLQNA